MAPQAAAIVPVDVLAPQSRKDECHAKVPLVAQCQS
jgi:hypothetical protein